MNLPCASIRYLFGCTDTFTPPATATAQPPRCRLWHARWIAVSDDEHIVSSARLGPLKLQKYEIRFATEAALLSIARLFPRACSCAPYSWYSSYITPTKTPTLRSGATLSRV